MLGEREIAKQNNVIFFKSTIEASAEHTSSHTPLRFEMELEFQVETLKIKRFFSVSNGIVIPFLYLDCSAYASMLRCVCVRASLKYWQQQQQKRKKALKEVI